MIADLMAGDKEETHQQTGKTALTTTTAIRLLLNQAANVDEAVALHLSNTAKIIAAFQKGYEESGNTTEVYYLSDRRQWTKAQKAFRENANILIALPLFVENIPGILLDFLSGLQPKKTPGPI